jgi:cytidine deaminase
LIKVVGAFYGTGINHYNIDYLHTSLHAEVDAVNHVPVCIKKKKKVIVFVFRTNKKGDNLMMAKPCTNCMHYIQHNLYNKGYKIHRICYTDENGNIQTTSNN